MADESDVSNAMVALIAGILYPNTPAAPSVNGTNYRIYRGWPQAANLDKDLAAKVVNITVGPRDGMSRNTTRYLEQDTDLSPNAPSITCSIVDSVATFGGSIVSGDVAGLAFQHTGYVYAVRPSDTLATVAAHFAATLGGTSSGASVTIPTNYLVSFAAVSLGQSARETRRTDQGFTVTIWAYDYPSRDAAAKLIDAALSRLTWLTLADGSSARIRWAQSLSSDHAENANLYRRDLIYTIEYPTLTITDAARALFVGATITRLIGGAPDSAPVPSPGNLYPI